MYVFVCLFLFIIAIESFIAVVAFVVKCWFGIEYVALLISFLSILVYVSVFHSIYIYDI